jgi:hypothetical protein
MYNPRRLDGVKVVRRAYAFDRSNRGTFSYFGHLGDTGPDELSVHDDIARTALTLTAADFGTCEAQLLTQHIGQRFIGTGNNDFIDTIDLERFLNHVFSSFQVKTKLLLRVWFPPDRLPSR